MKWIIIGVREDGKKKRCRYAKSRDEAFKMAVELSNESKEVLIFESKLALTMRAVKDEEVQE